MALQEKPTTHNQVKSKKRVTDHGEVFTSEREVNAMLDMVKQETERIDSRFLEPACGNGNFLAEVLKRKLSIVTNHYAKSQLEFEKYAISAISSIYGIDLLEDNVIECRNRLLKIFTTTYCELFKNNCRKDCCATANFILDRNIFCGDALRPEKIFNMKFDVIVGNPPYQLSDGGAQSSATPIYQKFVEQAIKLDPTYITMIIPARWYSGGKGLDEFRSKMLNDNRIKEIHDFPETSEVFPGLNIRGGVCYFLWSREHKGDCKVINYKQGAWDKPIVRSLLEKDADIFIRYNQAIDILKKVKQLNEKPFREMVSSQKPFGLRTFVKGKPAPFENSIKLYQNGGVGYVNKNDISKNKDWIDNYKVIVPRSSPGSDVYPHQVIGYPILSEPGSACTETYTVIGPFKNEKISRNVMSYMRTRFFRFLMILIKNTQDVPRRVYNFIPMQDFAESWSDDKLLRKYFITKEEVNFIDLLVRPMSEENT